MEMKPEVEELSTAPGSSAEKIQRLRCLSGMCGMPAMKRSNYCEYHGKEMAWRATAEKLGDAGDQILGFIVFLVGRVVITLLGGAYPMSKAYICGFHPEIGEQANFCPFCLKVHETRLNAEAMTGDERAAELHALIDKPLSRPFEMIHKRIEELVGRPVWTHEIGLRTEALIEEARSRPRDTPISNQEIEAKVIGSIPADKQVIIIEGQ